jgi:two-component system, cell cycle response regulator DivK
VSASPPVVLLVGDRTDSLAFYALSLLAMGFHPVTAETPDEAFVRACRIRPHAIVADFARAIPSVVDLSRRLRDDARTADAAILMVSDDPYMPAIQDLTNAGCDRVLTKPCPPAALALELYAALESRRRIVAAHCPARLH